VGWTSVSCRTWSTSSCRTFPRTTCIASGAPRAPATRERQSRWCRRTRRHCCETSRSSSGSHCPPRHCRSTRCRPQRARRVRVNRPVLAPRHHRVPAPSATSAAALQGAPWAPDGRPGAGHITATVRTLRPGTRVRAARCRGRGRPGRVAVCWRAAAAREPSRTGAVATARASKACHPCGRPRQRRRATRFPWMMLMR